MSEKKLFNFRDKKIGNTIRTHRHNLGDGYKTLEAFVYNRATELFDDDQWISVRHLSNIELGKNTLTIDKLITLADALAEMNLYYLLKKLQVERSLLA